MSVYIKNGIAKAKLTSHRKTIILRALLKPLIAYKYNGWQMAKYRSTEKATIVKTDTYVDLKFKNIVGYFQICF